MSQSWGREDEVEGTAWAKNVGKNQSDMYREHVGHRC